MNPTIINQCLYNAACPGGEANLCAEGYEGILCHTCAGHMKGEYYARTGEHECAACNSMAVSIIILIGLFLFLCGYLGVMMYLLISHPKRNKEHSVMLRIITNYFQIVMLVSGLDLKWPT